MPIAAIALSGLVALLFVATGMAKLLGHPKMVEASAHLGYSMRAFRIIGLLEVLGAAGILLAPLSLPLSISAATPTRFGSDYFGHASACVRTANRGSRRRPDRCCVRDRSLARESDDSRRRYHLSPNIKLFTAFHSHG
jgi:hypothetical protein